MIDPNQAATNTREAIAVLHAAERAADAAAPPAAAAWSAVDQISGRIAALRAERDAIAAARAAGERHLDDAGRVALIDMDVASLRANLAKAEAVAATMGDLLASAEGEVAAATSELDRAKSNEKVIVLIQHSLEINEVAADTGNKLSEGIAGLDAEGAADLFAMLMSNLATNLGVMASQIDRLGRIRQQFGIQVTAWPTPAGLDESFRILRHQLGMRG